jgi:hypothetical protein
MGVEAHLGSDLSVGVRAALAEYTRRLGSDTPPLPVPRLARGASPTEAAKKVIDLPVNGEIWEALEREAARQNTTVSELAAHSVLLYLAEIDRMTPLNTV